MANLNWQNTVKKIVELLKARQQTISFAESCTVGQLSAVFGSVPGVSAVFLGSAIVYHNRLKENWLGIEKQLLEMHGAVSQNVAIAMAQGVRLKSGSDWSLSITGIAGPSGGTKEKPVGTVWFALCGANFESAKHQQFLGDREKVQEQAVRFAMEWMEKVLSA